MPTCPEILVKSFCLDVILWPHLLSTYSLSGIVLDYGKDYRVPLLKCANVFICLFIYFPFTKEYGQMIHNDKV